MRDQSCLITRRETKKEIINRSQDANNKFEQDYQGQIKSTTLRHHIRCTASGKIINDDSLRYHIPLTLTKRIVKYNLRMYI